ncbi:MAG: hypothetical protein ABI835_22155, partial [Chloroflexota bacterium]
CWFFRNPPPSLLRGDDLKALRDLPLFHLWSNADHSFSVSVNERLHGLGEIVAALLEGKIRFCETAAAHNEQTLEIAPFPVTCPTCARPTLVYRVDPTLTALCGRRFKAHPLEFRREVLAALRNLMQVHPHLKFGRFAETIGESGRKELRFGCSQCGAAISPEQIEMALYGAPHLLQAERFPVTITFPQPLTARAAHWCFPDNGSFCCER